MPEDGCDDLADMIRWEFGRGVEGVTKISGGLDGQAEDLEELGGQGFIHHLDSRRVL